MGLYLLRLGSAFNRQGAARVAKHVRGDVLGKASAQGVLLDDVIYRLVGQRLATRMVARQADEDLTSRQQARHL